MKAVLCTKYGSPLDVVKLQDVDQPAPADDRVLVKVRAASVNPVDLAPVKGQFAARLLGTGLFSPRDKRLGTDIAGMVEAVGKDVKQFYIGDEVFGTAPGGFAEYASARGDLIVIKPKQATFEEAAAVPVAAITALQGIRQGGIQPGQKVLISGASGGVGTYAVQIARSFGTEVTAVCSTKNLDQALAMGADHAIDYTREDFTKNREKYDLILAVNGHQPLSAYRSALSPRGTCIVAGGSLRQVLQAMIFAPMLSKKGGRQIRFMGIARLNQKDLLELKELLAAGKIKPVIDRRYPLSQAGEAMQYLAEGHARGKIVLTL